MANKSELEFVKEGSRGLRGSLHEELGNPAAHLDKETGQLAKFHGLYQQDDRDLRRDLKKQGKEPAYSCMVRTKIPGGILTADQYLILDRLAEEYGNGTLRATNRQDIQFHGVLKRNLRATIHQINEALLTTLGACGDVVRNVVCCPAPHKDRQMLQEYCQSLTQHFLPHSKAYHEIWVDGEKVIDTQEEIEPLYGSAYLPRKFKIGLTFPHDNCIEVHTNDLGLVAVMEHGELKGFNVFAGGSLGMSQGKSDTYPRLASPIGFAPKETITEVVEGIFTIQRDFGNRENRQRARLKYLLDERGTDWFTNTLNDRIGFDILPIVDTGPYEMHDHLGWHQQEGGHWYLGIHIENGRIKDQEGHQMRTALKEIVETYKTGVRITSQQNVLLTDIPQQAITDIENLLRTYGVKLIGEISQAKRWSMACPAFPTCGLAITEAERILPSVIKQIENDLEELQLGKEPVTIRMTGCPNGCARPYTAELAFTGRSREKYTVYIGGSFEGTRLTQEYADLVPLAELAQTVRPLFAYWKTSRQKEERFGDFCLRIGIEKLRQKFLTPA